jgi:hypothetical protein
MSRRIYISCEFPERRISQVEALDGYLQQVGCKVQFAPFGGGVEFCGYDALEAAIEQADAFIAVAGRGYDSATWLNHELWYAHALNRHRFNHRPRLFGLPIPPYRLPRCSEHIELEWLNESNRELLLEAQRVRW